jgi:hypothetical protein
MITRISIWIIFILILPGASMKSCYKESSLEETETWLIPGRVLEFDGVFAFCDKEDHLLLYSLPADTLSAFNPMVRFGDYQSVQIDGRELIENQKNDLGEVRINHPYSVSAQKGEIRESYQLFFTNLPLLHIHTEARIQDEPKEPAWAELAFAQNKDGVSGPHLFAGYAGIEIRGRTSAAYEKKSYGLELWENPYGDDHSVALLGMRLGEDWILDAMYMDPLRMRNKLSFELWEQMWSIHSHKPFNTSNPGINCEFIELFVNQRYMGLYCLSERLDEMLINLDGTQSGPGGILYKAISWIGGSTAFSTYNSEPGNTMIWEGWEQIYPDDLHLWEPLAELRKTVVLRDDEDFEAAIGNLLNLDVAAEYYLFTNLILAHDNVLKNYFLARYPEQSAFLFMPWDLEGSWGITWDGGEIPIDEIIGNNLFNRLLELDVGEFEDLLHLKWGNYRESVFSLDSLLSPLLQYCDLLDRSGVIERENIRWEGSDIDLDEELLYFSNWITLRLQHLDQYFN